MMGGGQEPADSRVGQFDTVFRRPHNISNHQHNSRSESRIRNLDSINSLNQEEIEVDDEEDEDDDDSTLSDALLAVASAEEYAAKIIKLQQSCLTPLKEDLADWLNKIMNVSNITTDNFMEKLDNGVIICRLAKIISLWCEQQLTTNLVASYQPSSQTHNRTASQQKLTDVTSSNSSHSSYTSPKLSISTMDVHSTATTVNSDKNAVNDNYEAFQEQHSNKNTNQTTVAANHLRQQHPLRSSTIYIQNGHLLRSSSLSPNCLISSSTTSLNGHQLTGNQFLDNLIRINQTKIWEDAKCRTFYARDNVCNFIRWSKEFGVNQSVLFESDDLVLHANPRQVVLCLLDVARIACVRHGFTEAPGLVKFEQEIDRELAAEKAVAINHNPLHSTDDSRLLKNAASGDKQLQNNDPTANRKRSSLAKIARGCSMVDATDDLIMRYCMHKEEEAARKKAAELEAANKIIEQEQAVQAIEAAEAAAVAAATTAIIATASPALIEYTDTSSETIGSQVNGRDSNQDPTFIEPDSLTPQAGQNSPNDDTTIKSPSSSDLIAHKPNLTYDSRVDSLDSGEGRTESASTSHSQRTPINNSPNSKKHNTSSIPIPINKRSNSSSSLTSNPTSSMGTSELSSSRSSLLSGQENNSNKRHIASDLDGKVMRIAKSYYGKGATKGVKRLSEGKYKIADRIVFVRLLKGHRVMVRIGGGWDTLENFLFRHKSDPSQVIDVDNLLPLETKMTFEKTPQTTPTNSKSFSKLPYYRRSSSASSTNLSISNLSLSNHSPTSSRAASSINAQVTSSSTPNQQLYSHESPLRRSSISKQVPYFLIHRGQNTKSTPQQAFSYNHHNNSSPIHSNHPHKEAAAVAATNSTNQTKQANSSSSSSRYSANRLLGYSRTPTASSSNLYPATLTTNVRNIATSTKINPARNNANFHPIRRLPKQEVFLKMGRSNESLQAPSSLTKSPQFSRQQQQQNGSLNNGNLTVNRKMEAHQRSTNGLFR